MKIDIHNHIIPKDLPNLRKQFGYGDWISLDHHNHEKANMIKGNKIFRTIESNCWDPEIRLIDCDRHGVDIQVLSTIPIMFSYWAEPKDTLILAQILNDHISSLVDQFPKRFLGLGTIPLQDPKLAILELERCVNDLNLLGIQIGSNVNGKNLSDESLFSIFEAADNLGAAIFIHPWDVMGKDDIDEYWLPWLVGMPAETSRAICSMIFGGIFERLPNLRVAFAHGGGCFPSSVGRIQHGFEVRPDLCAIDSNVDPKDYLGRFWVDSLVHDPDALEFLIKKIGDKKIALGTDYPFPLGELSPGKLIEDADITIEIKDQLLFKNALDWLALPYDFFK